MNPIYCDRLNRLVFAASLMVGAVFFVPPIAPAAVLFSDDFNTNSSSLWTVNYAPAANSNLQSATFAFDYSPFGIPAAPGSGDTLGLRLSANIPGGADAPVTTRPAGVLSGLSVSPTGQSFGNSYHLSCYAWANFNGAPNASGLADNGASEGGTYNIMFAVGTAGTVPLVVGNTALVSGGAMDGIGFATTGDGGIANDYRVSPKSGTFVPGATPGIYAAGTTSNTFPYYVGIASLAPHTAPAIQQSLSTAEYGADAANTQAGQTQAGAFGFAWHKVDIIKNNNIVTWNIDDVLIATYDTIILSAGLGGNNIALGVSDVNTTTTRHPSLVFTIIDNLVVSDIPAPPTLQASVSGGNLNLSWPQTNGGGYVLESAGSLTAPILWTNVMATVVTNGSTFNVSVAATNAQSYFRLKQ